MLETEYRVAQGVSYVLFFVSYVISILLIPTIARLVALKLQGLWVNIVTYLIAFVLMFFVLPRIGTMLFNKK